MKKLLTCGLTVLVFAMSAKANIRVTPSGAEYYGAGASVSNLFVRGEQIIVTNGTLAVQDGTNAPITYVDEGTLATNLLGYVSTNDFASLSSNVASSNLVFQGHYNLLSTQKLDVAVAATQVWSVSQYPLAVTGTPWSASVSSNYDAIVVLATGKVDVITWSSSNQVYQGHYDLLSTQKLDVVVAATQVWDVAQYPLAITNEALWEAESNTVLLHVASTNNPHEVTATQIGAAHLTDGTNTFTGDIHAKQVKANNIGNLMSTGIIKGGVLSVTSTNTFGITAGEGYIVDNYTDPAAPTSVHVQWDAVTNVAVTGLGTLNTQWVVIDTNGLPLLFDTLPTIYDRREYIQLGKVLLSETVPYICTLAVTLPEPRYDVSAQVTDLIYAIGVINMSGNVINPSAAGGLRLQKSAGTTFRLGANYKNSYRVPSMTADLVNTNVFFSPAYIDSSKPDGFETLPLTNVLDSTKWDNGSGTLQTVDNNKFTIQRIYYFTAGTVFATFGQVVYNSMEEALVGVDTEVPVVNSQYGRDASMRAYIILKKGVTGFTDTSVARIIPGGKFSGTAGGGGGGGGAGNVVGPASSVQYSVPVFADTTGELLTDQTGVVITNGGNLVATGTVAAAGFIQNGTNVMTEIGGKIAGEQSDYDTAIIQAAGAAQLSANNDFTGNNLFSGSTNTMRGNFTAGVNTNVMFAEGFGDDRVNRTYVWNGTQYESTADGEGNMSVISLGGSDPAWSLSYLGVPSVTLYVEVIVDEHVASPNLVVDWMVADATNATIGTVDAGPTLSATGSIVRVHTDLQIDGIGTVARTATNGTEIVNYQAMTNYVATAKSTRVGTHSAAGILKTNTFATAMTATPQVSANFGESIGELAQIEVLTASTSNFTYQIRTGAGIATNAWTISYIAGE